MTDKFKARVRKHAKERGLTYQAAHNERTRARGTQERPPDSAEAAAVMIALINSLPHEAECPISEWDGTTHPKPGCECIGVDTSMPLLDGADVYD